MNEPGSIRREFLAVRERHATLNAAIRRINVRVDLDSVFGESVSVTDGADFTAASIKKVVGAVQHRKIVIIRRFFCVTSVTWSETCFRYGRMAYD